MARRIYLATTSFVADPVRVRLAIGIVVGLFFNLLAGGFFVLVAGVMYMQASRAK